VSPVGITTALFLRSVFNRLAELPHPSDQQLQEAIDFLLAKNSRNYNRLLTFVHDLSIMRMCPWTNGPTSMTAKPTKVPVRRRGSFCASTAN
jgi:hypothetical protein